MSQQPPAPPPPPSGPPPGGPPPAPPPAPPPGGQPPAAYPPPPPGAPYGPGVARPGSVTFAAILLIILGAIACAIGVIVGFAGAAVASQFVPEAGAVVIVIGILGIVYGVFKIIAGAKVFKPNNGWRIAGIVLCAVAVVFWILSLFGSLRGQEEFDFASGQVASTGPQVGSAIFAVVMMALNIVDIVLLARAGDFFRAPRQY